MSDILNMAAVATTGTGTDVPIVSGEVSDEEAASFRLDPHLVRLLLHEPFFSKILRCMTKFKSEAVPTAGVIAKGDELRLVWNPRFVAGLEPIKIRGLLKHESYHLIFNHCTSRKQEPHILWNWATDLAINSLISENELPDGGLYPGKSLDLSKIEDPAALEKWKKVSELIESLPPKMASEWYMQKLLSNKEASETIQGDSGEGVATMDDHGGWGDLTDEQRQVMEGKIKKTLETAVRECDRTGNWGSVSSETRSELRRIVSNAVNWKAVLYNFCGRSQRMNKSRTLKKLNRKYPYIHSGVKRGHSANLAIYIDQSGSVSDDEVELFFGALNSLGRLTSFTLFPFDWSVSDDASVKWKRGQKVPAQRNLSGGTSFHAVNEHFKKHSDSFDGHIILTDGEASDPGPSRKRRCWVILPGCELMFRPHPGDVVVKMEKDNCA
tara:strand:- start:6591 stop:7907 length:1317 start_codon:yes stop_codon:yes gene_type:complete